MRWVTSIVAGSALVLSAGSLAAQTGTPPQRVGTPVSQVPVPRPVDADYGAIRAELGV